MQRGLNIGKLFGIDIQIDWSWLLIFILVTWNLASGFGNLHQDWGDALTWSVAIAASLLFFASVLAHEIAHSLAARAQGMTVHSITLFLFGGVSNIQRQPPSPRAEFIIAIVGPITSVVLGVLFILASGFRLSDLMGDQLNAQQIISELGPLSTLLLWLGPINIVLGGFNMIPGFPLDGGRVLRSLLWGMTDDLRRATKWASLVGQTLAWAMILSGAAMIFGVRVPLFGTGFINGLWLIFIGWFLNRASAQSYQRIVIQDVLNGVPVSQMMRSDPAVVRQDQSIHQLVDQYIMESDESGFPVVNASGEFTGIVTLKDVRKESRDQWDQRSVGDIMTPAAQVSSVSPEAESADAFQEISSKNLRQLPVLSGTELVGLLRRKDIVKWLQLNSEIVSE